MIGFNENASASLKVDYMNCAATVRKLSDNYHISRSETAWGYVAVVQLGFD